MVWLILMVHAWSVVSWYCWQLSVCKQNGFIQLYYNNNILLQARCSVCNSHRHLPHRVARWTTVTTRSSVEVMITGTWLSSPIIHNLSADMSTNSYARLKNSIAHVKWHPKLYLCMLQSKEIDRKFLYIMVVKLSRSICASTQFRSCTDGEKILLLHCWNLIVVN